MSNVENMAMHSESDSVGYVDIGVNLLDPMYSGTYRGKHRHESDMNQILERASSHNIKKMIITAGTIDESKEAYDLASKLRHQTKQIHFFSSVGVHPTRCQQEFGFDANQSDDEQERVLQEKINEMRDLIKTGLSSEPETIVTLGELGLDYARTEFCSIEHQKRGLLAQLKLALEFPQLPLFIHNRDTGTDLFEILKNHYCNDRQQSTNANDINKPNNQNQPLGVVHSFDGSLDLALKFIDLGLYIGINGCSLKTTENIETVKSIPLSNIVLETDGPWCDIRPSHASFSFVETKFPTKQEKKFESGCCVKNRTEPCHLIQVAEVIAGIKNISVEEVKEICWKNTHDLFKSLTLK